MTTAQATKIADKNTDMSDNLFHEIAFYPDPEVTIRQKVDAIAELLTFDPCQTIARDQDRLEQFELFREHLRTEMPRQLEAVIEAELKSRGPDLTLKDEKYLAIMRIEFNLEQRIINEILAEACKIAQSQSYPHQASYYNRARYEKHASLEDAYQHINGLRSSAANLDQDHECLAIEAVELKKKYEDINSMLASTPSAKAAPAARRSPARTMRPGA